MIKAEKGQKDEEKKNKLQKKEILGIKVEKKAKSFLLLLFNYAHCYTLGILLHFLAGKMK